MMIRLGYDIQFETVGEVPIVTLLNVHPSRTADLREPDELRTDPLVKIEKYQDALATGLAACLYRREPFGSTTRLLLKFPAPLIRKIRRQKKYLSINFRWMSSPI